MNILLCRFRPWQANMLAKTLNRHNHQAYSVSLDDRAEYLSSGEFQAVYQFPHIEESWTEYRQYLRDIPQQEEFPNIEIKSFEEFQQDLE